MGALCGAIDGREGHSCNGGLSLRRVDAARAALSTMTPHERLQPEDVAFSACLERTGGAGGLADGDAAYRFAVEEYGDASNCVGVHGTDKGFLKAEELRAILRQADAERAKVVRWRC